MVGVGVVGGVYVYASRGMVGLGERVFVVLIGLY